MGVFSVRQATRCAYENLPQQTSRIHVSLDLFFGSTSDKMNEVKNQCVGSLPECMSVHSRNACRLTPGSHVGSLPECMLVHSRNACRVLVNQDSGQISVLHPRSSKTTTNSHFGKLKKDELNHWVSFSPQGSGWVVVCVQVWVFLVKILCRNQIPSLFGRVGSDFGLRTYEAKSDFSALAYNSRLREDSTFLSSDPELTQSLGL